MTVVPLERGAPARDAGALPAGAGPVAVRAGAETFGLPIGVSGNPTAERIVDAAMRCVARWGVAKTTLDDVAREAGCGRATLYRLFPGGRDAVWDAVVATEAARFFDRISALAHRQASLEDVLVACVTEASRTLTANAALQFLLAHEPEAILPFLAFSHMDRVLHTVSTVGAPLLVPWLASGDDGVPVAEAAARAVEWVTRITISYLTSPHPDVDLCEEASVRRLIRTFVLPGLRPASSA